jgi:hypothetical protein
MAWLLRDDFLSLKENNKPKDPYTKESSWGGS